jgi:hypothetical protein
MLCSFELASNDGSFPVLQFLGISGSLAFAHSSVVVDEMLGAELKHTNVMSQDSHLQGISRLYLRTHRAIIHFVKYPNTEFPFVMVHASVSLCTVVNIDMFNTGFDDPETPLIIASDGRQVFTTKMTATSRNDFTKVLSPHCL